MSQIHQYVTESQINSTSALMMPERFILLNMSGEGVWLVDRKHPQYEEVKNVAISIAKTFGDKEMLENIDAFSKIEEKVDNQKQ